MKNVREIQYEKVRALYQELIRSRNELPSTDKIRTLSNETIYSTERTPMSGNYRVTGYENIDVNALNSELGLCKVDSESISEYLSMYQDRMRGLEFVSSVWQEMAKRRIIQAMNEVVKISSPIFVKGFTEELDPSSITDREETTLTILDDGTITLMPVTTSAKNYTHRARDISIRKIGSDALSAEILGEPTSVVNIGETGGVVMSLSGNRIEEAGFIFEAKTRVQGVNQISLNIGEETTGIKLQVDVSENGTNYKNVLTQVVRREKIDIPMDDTDISVIRVTMTMTSPNVVMLDEGRYEFRLYSVVMTNATRRNSGAWQSTELPITSDIAHVSLAVEDEVRGDTTLKYFVSVNKDADDKAIGFMNIDPTQTGSVINLGNSIVNMEVGPLSSDPRWKILPEKKWGSKLYNILNIPGLSIESSDFSIVDGAIKFTSDDMNIVEDTIKLYRGSYDFIQKERHVELERHVDNISCDVDMSATTEWVDPVSFRVRWRELIDGTLVTDYGNNYKNRIRVNWRIENPDDIQIERDDGQELYFLIQRIEYLLDDNSIVTIREYKQNHSDKTVDATYITLAGMKDEVILDDVYYYYMTFTTNLSEYILEREVEVELDLKSFVVQAAGQDLVQGVDYRIHPNMYKIELLKTGEYAAHIDIRITDDEIQGSSAPINISYDFLEKGAQSTIFYETNVYVAVPTDIVVLAFSAAEIAEGNFHIINEDDISTFTSYTLKQGWNIVRTTQPYPSANEYDTNELTSESSNAGIVIPENIENMRPFLDSMRQVSPFLLSTLEPDEGAKCFSFVDNKMYINFLPDFVEQDILVDPITSGTKGQVLLCKKPILDPDYTNTGYTSSPEKFEFEFAYTNEEKEKFIFIRIEINSQSGTSTARVSRLGLNKYQEIGGEE